MARSDGLGMAPPPIPGRETRRAGTGDGAGKRPSFEDWPQAVAEGLREGIGRAAAVKKDLEEALFQWEPRKANELSETLEEELATLNERAPKP
ncbi:hypothetical protein [Bilophila wadsworthia]|uniref:hypothetical protein n=1 Tax=Bilophila wadsworthia TaxID=35833 RepID=UPI003990DF11